MARSAVAPEVRELSTRLMPLAGELAAQMAERICAEIPFYAEGSLVSVQDLLDSCTDNVRSILGELIGGGDPSGGARVTGAARAQSGVPYDAVLAAYRVGTRVLWEQLVERADPGTRGALLLAAADIWAVSDTLAAAVTEAYRSTQADLARRNAQQRAAVVAALLDGDLRNADDVWRSAGALDLQPIGRFVVVAAENPGVGMVAMSGAERQLRAKGMDSGWRLDHDHHEGLVALHGTATIDDLEAELAGVAEGRVGLSAEFHRLDRAPAARTEARLAVRTAAPGAAQVRRFDVAPLAILLASTPKRSAELVQAVLGPVLDLPADDRASTLDTLTAWYAARGSTSATAQRLFLHRNSVRYRLRRFEELTGRDLADPADAAEVYVALESARMLGMLAA